MLKNTVPESAREEEVKGGGRKWGRGEERRGE